MSRTRVSVSALLGLIVGSMGLLLVLQSAVGFYRAYQNYLGASRIAVLSLGNAPLFASLAGEGRIRGLVTLALSAEAPAAESTFAAIDNNRHKVDRDYADAMTRLSALDLPGIAPILSQLRAAYDTAVAVRQAADAAIHLPKALRDPKIMHDEPLAVAGLQNAAFSANAFVEKSVRRADPLVDHFIAVRAAARAMHDAANALASRIQGAIGSERAWTRADLTQAAVDRVRINVAWKTIVDAAALPSASAALIAAANQVKSDYFGYDTNEQNAAIDTLRIGRVSAVTLAEYQTRATAALAPIARVADASTQAIIGRTNKQRDMAQTGFAWNAALFAAAVALTALGCLTALGRVSRPVRKLTAAMRTLAQAPSARDLPIISPGAGSLDEIGEMQTALGVFHNEMRRAEELSELTATQRDAETAQATDVAAKIAAMTERQGEVVETMVFGLMHLAEGNLAFTLPVPLAAEYERLRRLFNDAVQGLQATVRDVLTRAETIGSGTGEIAQAADDLARRTQQQAASLEQTAAALAELTASVRQTAAGSARAQALATAAKTEAVESTQVVNQTVAAMEQIEESARQIGQIITLIDEIAFQTNLLALNAGVEAVRAGDSGRGFAVIASEVRALAQRAGEAAREITGLVNTSMQHVERGVQLVGKTGQALNRIQQGVVKIDVAISEIAASAQEQSSGLVEVNESVAQMDQVTQQNAAMVEQSTAATFALAQETQELTRAVQHFTIEAPQHVADAA